MDKAGKLILGVMVIFMALPLYGADNILEIKDTAAAPVLYYPLPIYITNRAEDISFSEWVNIVKRDTKDDTDALREEWKQALRVDIFFAHFKAKEIAHKIEEKSKFKLFNMRGRAKIKQDSATYTFSHKF
ncbi:MAG: hypothetical protein WC312_08205 [Candidatus Omnitrophota bacterium]|jgi:hypothetical protein